MSKLMSDTVGQIAEALAKAQVGIKKAIKNSDNTHHRSKYAELSDIISACQPHLANNGISFTGGTIFLDGQYIYIGMIMHTSGEWIRTMIPLLFDATKINPMQAYGSAQTYAERYALKSLVGVACSDEDDDGEKSFPQEKKEYKKPETQNTQSNGLASEAQIKYLKGLLKGDDIGELMIMENYGIKSLTELTSSQANQEIKKATGK